MRRTANMGARSWRAVWQNLLGTLAPPCANCECVLAGSLWRRMRRRSRGVRMQGERYCRSECLESALTDILARARPVSHQITRAVHRVPLGLLLLSRQELTAAQLRIALEAQRAAGSMHQKKIGAWLQELGFATEGQITAALSRQWSCPVLRTGMVTMGSSRFPAIPVLLLQSFQMMPVELVEASRTLLIAFGEGIDYTMLYAIEQMLGYRTEACLVSPSTMQKSLQALTQQRDSTDVIFERLEDAEECAHIIGNYSAKVEASEIRLARCGNYLWVRLERMRQEAVSLVLCLSAGSTSVSPAFHSVSPAFVV
jgi:hypothetical protein